MTPHLPDLAALRAELPPLLDRSAIARVATERFGVPTSPRTLEAWPLTWRRVNGKALAETSEVLDELARRITAAPATRYGRRPKAAQQAAA